MNLKVFWDLYKLFGSQGEDYCCGFCVLTLCGVGLGESAASPAQAASCVFPEEARLLDSSEPWD